MKKIKSMFFTALVIGVLCAGTVSARQLRSDAKALSHLWWQLRRQQCPAAQAASAYSPWRRAVRFVRRSPFPAQP